MKYNIGDSIRAVVDHNDTSVIMSRSLSKDEYTIRLKCGTETTWDVKHLESFTELDTFKKHTVYQVGTKVKIIDKLHGHCFDIGDIVEIISVTDISDNCSYGVKGDGGVRCVIGDEIELVKGGIVKPMDNVSDQIRGIMPSGVFIDECPDELPTEDSVYCQCSSTNTVQTNTAVHGKPNDDQSYVYCRACKKERL